MAVTDCLGPSLYSIVLTRFSLESNIWTDEEPVPTKINLGGAYYNHEN